ncbi:MAG: hypothetical protein H7832_11035 [Magnetococcus sp. DMHC-6]
MNAVFSLLMYLSILLPSILLLFLNVRTRMSRKNPLFFMSFVGVFVFNVIGSFEVFYNEKIFSIAYYSSMGAVIAIFYFLFILFRLEEKTFAIQWSSIFERRPIVNVPLLGALGAFTIGMFMLYYSRHGLPPIFEFDKGGWDVYKARGEKWTTLPEGTHWYQMGFFFIPTFLIVYCYILKVLHKKLFFTVLFYVTLIVSFPFLTIVGSKSPMIDMIFSLFIAQIMLKPGMLRLSLIFKYVFVALFIFFIIMVIQLQDRSEWDVLLLIPGFLFDRIGSVYAEAHAHMLNLIPAQFDYFYGLGMSNPGGIFPYTPVNLSHFLGYQVNGHLQNYSMPSFTHLYANFGWVGFFADFIILFCMISIVQFFFKNQAKSPVVLTCYIMTIKKLLNFSIETIQLVFSEEIVLVILLIIFFDFLFESVVIRSNRAPFRRFAHQ